MEINGINLEKMQVQFKLLSEWPYYDDKKKKAIITRLEQFYLELVEKSKGTSVKPFPQENGKVKIVPGMPNHSCSNLLGTLRGISQYGIIASEWFGIPESEKECRFCASIAKIHSEDSDKNAIIRNYNRLNNNTSRILLFLDESNPIMQKLLHLDYFEYERIKQQNPEELIKIYNRDEIELFDQIIEPLSPQGKSFHLRYQLPFYDWSAIPGGIPSTLVNGICIKSNNYEKEYVEEIARLFPNATIFNRNLEIIYISKIKSEMQEESDTGPKKIEDSER